MKQILFILACSLAVATMQAQESPIEKVQVGDVLVIGEPSGAHYKHVDVPRKNFIIKRGGIANMSTLTNQHVVVTDIWYGKNPEVTFKRADGKKFFRVYKTFTANLDVAIAAGELKFSK